MNERLRYLRASIALRTPWIYYTMCRFGVKRSDLIVERNTELVIEGYPRSGNSFSTYAFMQAQGREIRLAHHHHAQAQIIRAARWGIPACVLIREPEAAARSLVVRNPRLSVPYAIRKYSRFYLDVEPFRDAFVLASFEQVTRSLGTTIEQINCRFGTSFVPFVHTPEAENKVFEKMRRVNDQYNDGSERGAGMPSEAKERMKASISFDDHQALLSEAREIYRRFMDMLDTDSSGTGPCGTVVATG